MTPENMTNSTNSCIACLSGGDISVMEFEGRSVVAISIISLFLVIIMLTAILGNTAVIFAISHYEKLRQDVSYILIINLAITDLANGSLVMLSSLIGLTMDGWKLGQAICDIACALNYCLMITSMLTLFFISLDRYQAIMYPLHYHTRVTKKIIIAMVFYSWFQGIVFSIIPVIFRWIEYDYWEAVCAINWHREQEQALYYVIFAFALCYFIPGIMMTFCYVKISWLAKESRMTPPKINYDAKKHRHNTTKKVIRSLIIVVVAYFVCLTPFSVTKLMKVISQNSVEKNVNTAASLIAYCSSAVNPWIYGIFRKDFRHAYKVLVIKLCGRTNCISKNITFASDVNSLKSTELSNHEQKPNVIKSSDLTNHEQKSISIKSSELRNHEQTPNALNSSELNHEQTPNSIKSTELKNHKQTQKTSQDIVS